ncbi:MAG: DPP IV N-terminal domain-containing protein [Balneolaceae bacterium]
MKKSSVIKNRLSQIFIYILIISAFQNALAQSSAETTETDSDLALEAYNRAESMLNRNLSNTIFNNRVDPVIIDENRFWYVLNTRLGDEYFLVNVANRSKDHAFDHERLAQAISGLLESESDSESESEFETQPYSLNLRNLTFNSDLSMIYFEKNQMDWSCSLRFYNCEIGDSASAPPSFSVLSPDENLAAYTRDYNLWVKNLRNGETFQLTFDGVQHHSYGTNNHGWSRSERPILLWSPDSKKIATFRLDERDVGMMTLWRTRVGRPEADIWPYALPGDSIVPMLERLVLDVEMSQTVFLDAEPDHQRTSNCCGLIRQGNWADVEWSADAEKLAFVSTSRDYKDVTLRLTDPETGEVNDLYHEHDDIFFESNLTSRGIPNWRVLHNSSEFIWFTRKDNWGHLYLHDLESGELKNRITEGNWNVIDILHIDEESRKIIFTGVGKESGRDPYFEHLYSIHFDGTNLRLLTPEDANHNIVLSDNANWFVDTYSTFDKPPKTVLRGINGNLIMELEEADISDLLTTGWQRPIPFSVLARDSETDLYGLMILPSTFDENESYPIINMIYPGPQGGSLGSRNFSAGQRGQMQALAELGFVVVAIDALGSSPARSRDFHTYYQGNMMDNGLPDQITGMEQLAERYSFIDLNRVGIYGHSGGGFATSSALLQYPEFFKVGVSGAGNHDNRNYTYYWGEKYQGLMEEGADRNNYENQAVHLYAENLQGKLLLSYGTMDTNVHPSMTLLLVNELIRHNKDFDLIVMPNRGHGFSSEPYYLRRSWDYFYEHLAGKTPPREYQIGK